MRMSPAPHLDERRTQELVSELLERARAWIPSWNATGDEPDFGRALIEIAGRFSSEVTERLDRAGEKMRAGFLDWLAVRGKAARPARMPVVFKLADNASNDVLASAPVRMQVDAGDTPVIFETETDVRLVRGRLAMVVGVDADKDAFYLPALSGAPPAPGLSNLSPLEPLPSQWRLKSFAAANSTKLQLDPDSGLAAGMIIEVAGAEYTIVQVESDIVTIDPPLSQGVETELVKKVTSFAPFDGAAHNWQEHALYLGDMDLLNIEAAATIEVSSAKNLITNFRWQYWGKRDGNDEPGWQDLQFAPEKAQKAASGLVLLKKFKGPIEARVIDGKNSRWIRAFTKTANGADPLLSVERLTLKVNCVKPAECPSPGAVESPPSEAMTNTTPIVLSGPFYPLGREPRQFDAFYLGNKEAFSKKRAKASVCFEMSDATCLAYAAVRDGSFGNQILAGVGKDRALHLLKIDPATGIMASFRGPLRPPIPPEPNIQVEDSSAPVTLNPGCTPVIWTGDTSTPNDFYVAVAAGGDIWIWHENAGDAKQSGWKKHSSIPKLANLAPQVEDIIVLKSEPRRPGAVLSAGRFWVYNDPEWIQPPQPQPPKLPLRDYAALAPIYDGNGALTEKMVAVSTNNKLYQLEKDGTETAIAATVNVDVDAGDPQANPPIRAVRPAAFDDGTIHVVALSEDRKELIAIEPGLPPQSVSLTTVAEVLGSHIGAAQVGAARQFSIALKTVAGEAVVASWIPTFVAADSTVLFESPISGAAIAGTPLLVGNYLVVPGSRADAYVSQFDSTQRLSFTGSKAKQIVEGVIVPGLPVFSVGDFISVMPATAADRMGWQISTPPSVRGTDVIYIVEPSPVKRVADNPQLIKYSQAPRGTGLPITGAKTFQVIDPQIEVGAILRIESTGGVAFCEVQAIDTSGLGEITTVTSLPGTTVDTLSYWLPTPAVASVAPVIEFVPWGDGNWDASILDRANLYFLLSPTPQPSPQRGTAYGVTGGHPTVVALNQRWTAGAPPLNAPTQFIIDAVTGAWSHQLGDTASNPELSWEYWNGKGWWSLPISNDGTDRFATTGALTFTVPNDIAESDWAGKTNFWIRARLVGGDYGHEEVKVIIKPPNSAGETEQVVERSSDNIKAPLILDLHISYTICDPALPIYVLAQDSGSTRDQSDANRTAGAIVEAFVPLGVALGRLSGATTPPKTPVECPPECSCQSASATTASTPSASASPTGTKPPATGRALLIGLSVPPSEAPVNILLLVDERKHDAFAPMKIETLVGDRFLPIVTKDATRALGETGVLSLSFEVEPTLRELFDQNLCWIRLSPANSSEQWKPKLHGAYLNAVWASATETLTRELVGSSEGAPNLTLSLARPPVLHDTLELRVKEPLGDEERKKLLDQDNQLVKNIEELPGDWVLWKSVIDPGDELPTARVYALDESTGEIRFGDGRHGMIPPIGTDSIVAFSYQRTETGTANSEVVPANTITARTQLNLVSPVPSVEAVFAADQAAGGAPPEVVDRVVRFGTARLRHRERVVSVRDLEDITLQSSPKIIQARGLPRSGYLRLVVVMKGDNPAPSAAEIRELRRLLLAAAPSGLSADNFLRIETPVVRRLRVDLTLRIEDLDYAGEVGRLVRKKLTGLFDTATGGASKDGWALGENPTENDIAVALIDIPQLEGIRDVKLVESIDDHSERPWPQALGWNELAMLADDPLRIQFEVPEVVA